ncbi:ribosomal L27e protein family-domain-containing protein [Echria macrotheca]|uniref:Ribosomal L27e protein family-domain-containing protein n=1 Tax=Echria macrotheca TaxID=438768 RepID=A0AAJ0FAG5_9PEZI|nr:ribosomal L27e protein family-domain-containing protein [Echria macrotheca]
MAFLSLSRRDLNILEIIKDPESDPSLAVFVDNSLPKDPHIRDTETYASLAGREREIILAIQQLETQYAGQPSGDKLETTIIQGYRDCVARFGDIINECPHYASARNNRAQALRRLYGDTMLLANAPQPPQALIRKTEQAERLQAAETVLSDLEQAISLLTPAGKSPRMSPQAARTLSLAHTQRAAIYLMTSKLLASGGAVSAPGGRREGAWSKLDFEESASRDFAMGGRYGNEIAKGLAVSTNPTAKLCGQMVREAMKKESEGNIRTDTMKFLKTSRVCLVTRGRYAGKKVVIIQPVDNGTKAYPYGHALVAGIERYPSKITRRMSKARQEKRSKVKPFIKVINYNHLMPTRYTLELEGLKGVVSSDTFKEVSQREDAKKTVKKVLEERYTSGKNRWFFTPLKF